MEGATVRTSLAASILLFALAACGGESPRDRADAGSEGDVAGTETGCQGLPVAREVGNACAAPADCASGAECSVLEGEALSEGRCRQRCRPLTCDAVCATGEGCLPLTNDDAIGVCAPVTRGTRVNYETCSDELGACVDGLFCLVASEGASEGVCLQPCDEGLPCPTFGGVRGRCVIDVDDPTGRRRFCAPECPALGADAQCPGPMTCEEAGFLTVCAFGAPDA
jgi:hypothetical protein